MSKRLEIEVDYELSQEEYESYLHYKKSLTDDQAARQVAQDVLGYTGVIVQGAEFCDN